MTNIILHICMFGLGTIAGVMMMCVVINGDERRYVRPLEKKLLCEGEWYYNANEDKYYRIASKNDILYLYNGGRKDCIYVLDGLCVTPIFFKYGDWFKNKEGARKYENT